MWRFLVLISAARAAEDAPAPAPAAAPAAEPKEWTCGPHVKEDAEALRRRVDALYADQRRLVAEVFPRGFKVKPRDPAWKSLTSSGAPDRRSWYRRTIGMWLPHKFFPDAVPVPPCPTDTCRGLPSCVNASTYRWPTNLVLRRVE